MLNYFAYKTTSNPQYAGFLAKKQSDEHARHHEKKLEWQPLFCSQFLNLCRAQPDTLRTAQQHLGNRTLYYQGNYWNVSLQAPKLSSTIHRYSHVSGNRIVSKTINVPNRIWPCIVVYPSSQTVRLPQFTPFRIQILH